MSDFLSGIFGSKPQIADYTPINMSQEQITALQGDIAAWPDIQQLGNLYQSYMLNAYETAIPGFKDILAQGGQTTKDMLSTADTYLHGEIPADVQAQVQRSSAFQNLMSGGGGGMANANTARNYGLTSMDLIGRGAQLAGEAGNAAQRWAALSGAQMPEGMLVTPQQQAALDMQQNLIKRNIQQQKYNVAAAPDPTMKGLSDIVENLTAAYLGGKVGTIGAGNQAATSAAGDVGYMGGQPAGAGPSDVSNPGYYTSGVSPGNATGSMGGYYGGYGGVSPGGDGSPAYSGLPSSFNSSAPTNLWDSYSYNSNFPTG